MTQPYTYLVGWKEENKWYYGVRYANNCNPSDLWNPYKTSSKFIKDYIEKYGNPTIIEIRKTFKTKSKAKSWEDKVLRRLNVAKSSKWINKSNNNSFKNIIMDDDIRRKISEARRKGIKEKKRVITNGENQRFIPISEEIPKGWRIGQSDKTKETQAKIDHNPFKNKTAKEMIEIGKKISAATKGKKKPDGHGANVSKASKGKSKPWQQGEKNVSKRIDVKEKISKSWATREMGVWYTNETDNFYIKKGNFVNPLWRKGKASEGKSWYNNGLVNKMFTPNEIIPFGFLKGKITSDEGMRNIVETGKKPKSESHKLALSIAKTRKNRAKN